MVGTRVFVGNLPSDTNERDLERFFRGFGRMREVLLKNGYGFVEFDDYRDAEDAVYELNGKKLLGVRVTVEKARGTPRGRDQYYARDRDYPSRDYRARNDRYGPPTRTAHRLIVENLSTRVSWQDLKDYMRQAGEVTYADAHKKNRNEGVVEFASNSDMRNALTKLDDTEINGRRIKLIEDKRHSSRSSSYSSRSRSPRKSRSSSRSRSPAKKSKSRSISKKSRSNSRAKSVDRSRSRSRQKDRSHSRVKNGSRSRDRSHSRQKDRSRTKDRSRSRQKDRAHSKDRTRSKSRSPVRRIEERSRSRSVKREDKSRSRSRSRSRSHD